MIGPKAHLFRDAAGRKRSEIRSCARREKRGWCTLIYFLQTKLRFRIFQWNFSPDFRDIFEDRSNEETIIRARTNPWTDGWTGKGCFVTGRPLGFADASGVAARGKQRRGVIGGERERERYDVPEAKYP